MTGVMAVPDMRLDKVSHTLLGRSIFTGLYGLVIFFFVYIDVYNLHFFAPRYALPYNLARIAFTAYLFWIVYFSGATILEKCFKDVPHFALGYRLPLGFFAGASLWTLSMLVMGYLSLYTWPIVVIITVAIIAVSYPHFCDIKRRFVRKIILPHPPTLVAASIAIAFAVLLLIVKGLYPAGGHDYFTHYFYYYDAVIKNHNVWPNEVWYHYYYDKGMGLFFLGILLTDPLAPSLVTFCFASATAMALFAFVNRFNPGTWWPWMSVILYFALYTTTFGTGIYAANGGWGDFQKPHEVNAAFMIATLWMSVNFLHASAGERKIWWFASALCAFVLAFLTTVSSLLIGLFYVLMTVACLLFRSRENAIVFFGLSVATGAGLLSLLVLNYLTTGLPLDNAVELFWPILNLQRLREWGVIPELLELVSGRSGMFRNSLQPISDEMLTLLHSVVRGEVLKPFLVNTVAASLAWGAVCVVVSVFAWSRPTASTAAAFPMLQSASLITFGAGLVFGVSLLVVALTAGSVQPISFVRYSSFALPLTIGMAAAMWQLIAASLPRPPWLRMMIGQVVPAVLLVVTLGSAYQSYGAAFVSGVTNAARFVTGRLSIYGAYIDQSGWPAPASAIQPWALATWKLLGPGTRFWVFDVHTYCMLPGCRPEAFMSFRMSPRSIRIMLGNAMEARDILKQEGLNYFLIAMDDAIRDPLPCTDLFSPDHIAEYLGVKWRDDAHVLLTWLGPGIEPLAPAWLAQYRTHAQTAPCAYRSLLQSLTPQIESATWGVDVVRPGSAR
jgi:hypothetical protein